MLCFVHYSEFPALGAVSEYPSRAPLRSRGNATIAYFDGMTPNATIADYRITSNLVEGGMGTVYRATDTELGRDVAIKILPEALAQEPDRMARFEREAKALASLNHPHIAQIHGIEEGALVMELVEGEPLKGPLPIEKAVEYAGQILEALDVAHKKGIVHRDLKPIFWSPGKASSCWISDWPSSGQRRWPSRMTR